MNSKIIGALSTALMVVSALAVIASEPPDNNGRARPIRGSPISQPAGADGSTAKSAPAKDVGSVGPATNPVAIPKPSAHTRPANPQYHPVGFDRLSAFQFNVTARREDAAQPVEGAALQTMAQIPKEIKALNEKEVSVRGFMLPMKSNGGLTTEFLLLKNQGMCCYGLAPKVTEWINVRTSGKGVKVIMDEPITVCGIFHVGDVRQQGELLGIYRLDAEKLERPAQ
jgi:hypothetical protein